MSELHSKTSAEAARAVRALGLLLAAALMLGCDGPPPMADGGSGEPDAQAPRERHREELPDPGPLTAGLAQVSIPAPVGIGTMGFGAVAEDPSVTPFADQFPGTTRLHAQLNFRAVAFSRGPEHQVILVRLDTVGVFQQLREAVLDELEARLGRRLDDALVLAGNHTHSGPGRVLMAEGALVALSDTFFPEVYDRMIDALADVVEQALEDARPAEIGYVMASSSEGHGDRRCENDALDQVQESPDLPVVAVRRDGRVDALIASYAYHGTVLGISQLTLSGDMGSVVEQKIEERFEHPVMVLFFNSWGGDMSPASPEDPGTPGPAQPGGYDRMERLGEVLADAVMPRLTDIDYAAEVPVRARTYRVRLDRDSIGYDEDTFRYPYGAVFCGLGADGNCMDATPIEGLDSACIRILDRDNLPKQTVLTAGEIGELRFVTGPGEWTTGLAVSTIERIGQASSDVMFIGYAQDHTGYSLSEEDWWQGGYEASGSLWGPRQGDYLAERLVEAFETYRDEWVEPPWIEPSRAEPFSGYTYEPYAPESPRGLGTLSSDVAASAAQTDVVTFTVQGSDPWLGPPVATLEHDAGSGFAPVLRTNGLEVKSDSYDMWVDLTTDPTYESELRAAERTFSWTFHFPVSRRASSSVPPLAGPHRFAVRIPTGEDTSMVVHTGTFNVE